MSDRELALQIRDRLSNPLGLCERLNLMKGGKRQTGGVVIFCPFHDEKTPSCSVLTGPDKTVCFKCWGCQETGDALHLIAQVNGLSLSLNFVDVLKAGCELAGIDYPTKDESDDRGKGRSQKGPVPPPRDTQERQSPPDDQEKVYLTKDVLEAFWSDCTGVDLDVAASGHLVGRRIDPVSVQSADLARVIPEGPLPGWAKFQGRDWRQTGHRMVMKAYDADGMFRSVRAWRVTDGDSPKRLPPAGYKGTGFVLANRTALRMLRGDPISFRVVIVEGEPDALVWTLTDPTDAVIGIISGSWHDGFAAKIPYGSEVVIRTHLDAAGDKYAQQVTNSVKGRAQVYRLTSEAA